MRGVRCDCLNRVMNPVLRPPDPQSPATPYERTFPSCDAHNHLQDERFAGRQEEILASARAVGVTRMVVNGACESDWPMVADLARRHPEIVPSFGYHPWYLGERTETWRETLSQYLKEWPDAGIGEIGLDRWMLENPERWRHYRADTTPFPGEPPSLADQVEAFVEQLRLAAERDLPMSIHCLQAWGRLRELLAATSRPARGFLLHSYSGSAELILPFVKLGAYFSFSGYFLHERKARQREVFRQVPRERLLVETDAPDQLPPEEFCSHPLAGPSGRPLNHPANLPAIRAGLADVLGVPSAELSAQVAANFQRLFDRPPRGASGE